MGGKTGPVAEETQAGRSHQQSTSGFLPEGLEDLAEVSWSIHRWICVAFFYHKRGTLLYLQRDSMCVFVDVCMIMLSV